MADTSGGPGQDGARTDSDDVVSLEPEPTQEEPEVPEQPEVPEEPELPEEPVEPVEPVVEPEVHPALW